MNMFFDLALDMPVKAMGQDNFKTIRNANRCQVNKISCSTFRLQTVAKYCPI